MRIILLVIAVLSFGVLSAQQINPVPDYVFKNQMSVGRAAVTDTAAYMSIGPRYGATKGFMPPMVTDTASLPANKRNGLFIFSIQKNKYLYWDSVGVKWAEMAGTAGAAITGSGTANTVSKFTTTTNIGNSRITDNGTLVSTPRLKADSMMLLPKINMTPTDSGAVRYQVSDSSLYLYTGNAWRSVGSAGIVDSVKMYSSSLTLEANYELVEDTTNGNSINKIVKTVNADGTTTVTLKAFLYISDTLTTNNAYNKVGTIPVGYRPNVTMEFGYQYRVTAGLYQRSDDTNFTFNFGSVTRNTGFDFKITPDGSVYCYGNTTQASAFFINPYYYVFYNIMITYVL